MITFILLLVSSFSFIRYTENRKAIQIIISLFSFFVALLTRESAVPFIALVPLVAYFFFNQTIKKSLLLSVPFAIVFAGYMALRLAMVGFTKASNLDIGNAPFLYATPSEAFATKVFILFKYIGLLFFPYPLSSDYGYNQIPYIGVTSVPFILSELFYTALIIFAIYTFRKKSIYSFCIFFFLITIILFANFIIEIGAPLAERLLFQPSLAFCILLAVLYSKTVKQFALPAKLILLMVLLLFSAKTIMRNKDWKNNETLYFTDVLASPNSIRPNLYAANQYIKKALGEPNEELKKEYYSKAILYDERIAPIHPDFRLHADLGLAYFGIKDYFNAANNWLLAYQMSPDDTDTRQRVMMLSEILFNEGNNFSKTGNATEAIRNYKKAVELNENNVDAWYNLSRTYAFIKDEANAREAWYQMQKHTTNPQPYPEQK
jgi:protein O-mannosyl-transferase